MAIQSLHQQSSQGKPMQGLHFKLSTCWNRGKETEELHSPTQRDFLLFFYPLGTLLVASVVSVRSEMQMCPQCSQLVPCWYLVSNLLVRRWYPVGTPLVHCWYTFGTLLIPCCYLVGTLLVSCCYLVATLLVACCYLVGTLLLPCWYPGSKFLKLNTDTACCSGDFSDRV